MKAFKILMIAVLSIFSAAAFAQDSTTQKTKPSTQQGGKVTYSCPMHAEVTSDKPGKCPKCGMTLTKAKKEVVYTCPMHPEVTSDKPGKCPKCDMKLKAKKG